MAGLAVLLRKELLESWRTYRLPVVAGLFLFVGLSSPLLARYLPEILEAAGGDQFGGLQLPTPTAADAVDQLWKNLAQFGAFAAIILAMGAVAGEKDRGTAAFVLSKTASRGGVPRRQGRGDRGRPGHRHGPRRRGRLDLHGDPVRAAERRRAGSRWACWPGSGLGAWAAITFLGSTVTGSTAAAAGIGFMALLLLSIVSAVPSVAPYTPGGLAGPAIALAAGAAGRGRRCAAPGASRPRPDRDRARGRRLVVPAAGAVAPVRPRRRGGGPRSARASGRGRRGPRRCPGRGAAAASGSSRACRESRNGIPTWRMTPQAGCSCSTVIPRAAASGDANASTMSWIGPLGILGRLERRRATPPGRARGTAPPGSGGARPDARRDRRWSAKRGSAASSGETERLAERRHWRSEPTATAIGPSAVSKVSYGTMLGCALPRRPGATAGDERVLRLVDEAGQGGPQQRDVDALAARQDRPGDAPGRTPLVPPPRAPPARSRPRASRS